MARTTAGKTEATVTADMTITIPKKITVNSFNVTCMAMDGSGESVTVEVKTAYVKADLVIKSIQPKMMKAGYVAVQAVINETKTEKVDVIK